jgi:ribosome-binding protein aMBF1 (putative translation factor)
LRGLAGHRYGELEEYQAAVIREMTESPASEAATPITGRKEPAPPTSTARRTANQIIDEYRKVHGLSNEKLAKQLRVDVSVVYALKRGRSGDTRCSPDTLARIARILGCQPGDLAPTA